MNPPPSMPARSGDDVGVDGRAWGTARRRTVPAAPRRAAAHPRRAGDDDGVVAPHGRAAHRSAARTRPHRPRRRRGLDGRTTLIAVRFNPTARVVIAADFGARTPAPRSPIWWHHARRARRTAIDRRWTGGRDGVAHRYGAPTALTRPGTHRPTSPASGSARRARGVLDRTPHQPADHAGWDRFDIPAAIHETFDAPVLVDNDVATGIGAGVISGGSLRRGAQGAAGDIGHIALARASDVPCPCGNRGCIEAIASGKAVARSLIRDGIAAETPSDVIALVKSGNVTAVQAVRQAGRDLGEVLTACVSLMNPAVIVIGGTMAQAAEHLVAGVREVVHARSIPLSTEHLTIASSRAASDAAILGAAQLAIDAALLPSSASPPPRTR
ncbi:Xylose repressor, partial [Eumeta japonica]